MSTLKSYLIVSNAPDAGATTATENFVKDAGARFGNAERPADFQFVRQSGKLTVVAGERIYKNAIERCQRRGMLLTFIDVPTDIRREIKNGFYLIQDQQRLYFCPLDHHDPENSGQKETTYEDFGLFYRCFFQATLKRPDRLNFDPQPCEIELPVVATSTNDSVGRIYWNPIPVSMSDTVWNDRLRNRDFLKAEPVGLLPLWRTDTDAMPTYLSAEHRLVRVEMRKKIFDPSFCDRDGVWNLSDVPAVFHLWRLADDPLFRDAMAFGGELTLNLNATDRNSEIDQRSLQVQGKLELTTHVIFRPAEHGGLVDYWTEKFFSMSDELSLVGLQIAQNLLGQIAERLGVDGAVNATLRRSNAQSVLRDFDNPAAPADPNRDWRKPFERIANLIDTSPSFRAVYEQNGGFTNAAARFANRFFMPTSHAWRDLRRYWLPQIIEGADVLRNEFLGQSRKLEDRLNRSSGFPQLSMSGSQVAVQMGNERNFDRWLRVAHMMPLGTTIKGTGVHMLNARHSKLNSNLVLG